MIEVTAAHIASINNCTAMSYMIEYSNGVKVRAVEEAGTIRKEYLTETGWKLSGRPYVVKHDRKRAAERIKAAAKAYIAA